MSSYSAMVQLAVARFQRNSLPGLSISPVVRTDFVPLLPDRTLTVIAGPGVVDVTLTGPSPLGPRPNRVDVVLERRLGPDGPAGGLPATVGEDGLWEFAGNATGTIGQGLQIVHSGESGLRVRVREVESMGRDRDPGLVLGSVQELEERVVFTDTVAL